jgi:hypothetical protein
MLTLTIGTEPKDVTRGTLTLPRIGVWVADLVVNGDAPVSGSATATLDGVDMPAHVQAAEVVGGMLQLRIVGGNGGCGKVAIPKHYKGPTVRHILTDLVRGAGEVLSPDCTTSVLNSTLKAWTSLAVPTGALLQALAETAGAGLAWRISYAGKVWLGVETWPMCPADVRIISADAPNRSQVIGTDALGIWPGTTIANRRIDSVVHEIGVENRSTVYWAEAHT